MNSQLYICTLNSVIVKIYTTLFSVILGLALITIASSCKSTKQAEDMPKFQGDEVVYQLKKGGCFGRCPIYKLSVYGNGLAEFEGERFTEMLGTYQRKLSSDEMKSLQSTFQTVDFDTLQASYKSRIPDLPLITVGYKVSDTLALHSGKMERPESLKSLQYALENLVKSDNWKLVKGADVDGVGDVEQSELPVFDKTKILVQFKPGVKLPQWFNEMKNAYGVRIVEKVPEDPSSWIITYTTANHDPEVVLQGIAESDAVMNAEFVKM